MQTHEKLVELAEFVLLENSQPKHPAALSDVTRDQLISDLSDVCHKTHPPVEPEQDEQAGRIDHVLMVARREVVRLEAAGFAVAKISKQIAISVHYVRKLLRRRIGPGMILYNSVIIEKPDDH